MQTKVIALPVIFLLFSLCGFSQSPENSSHPLLDKYYPHADTNKTVGSQINPLTNTQAPSSLNNIPAATNKPALTAQPYVPPPPQPEVTNTSTTKVPALTNSAPAATTTSQTTLSAVTTTPTLNTPAPVVTTAPVSKKPQTPPPPPYMDTRLGSSTKAYDTWEKNNNGAGSVTTSPK